MSEDMSPEEIAQLQKENCIFCKIVRGEMPSTKVYEDDILLAILDINPAVKGHVLVMPKEHYPILPAVPPNVQSHIFRMTKYLVKGIREGGVSTRASVFIANGAVAGQQSPHFLFHIMPRDSGDGLFSLPVKKHDESVFPALKTNVFSIISQYLKSQGRPVPESEALTPPPVLQPIREHDIQSRHDLDIQSKHDLATVLLDNPELKRMVIYEKDKIKELVKTNEDIARLFKGINIDKLSQKLRTDHADDKKSSGDSQQNEQFSTHGDPKIDKIARLFS